MNDDHGENTESMVKHYVGIDCSEAKIVSIDSLGIYRLICLCFKFDIRSVS
jgi:hypothetical protein